MFHSVNIITNCVLGSRIILRFLHGHSRLREGVAILVSDLDTTGHLGI